eukprot:2751770-Amphidinium_carterae.1
MLESSLFTMTIARPCSVVNVSNNTYELICFESNFEVQRATGKLGKTLENLRSTLTKRARHPQY